MNYPGRQNKKEFEMSAYYKGFRVIEIRGYNKSNWGFTAQIALDSSLMTNLIWVSVDDIEIR